MGAPSSQVKKIEDVESWFKWASVLTTGLGDQDEWARPARENFYNVLAGVVYGLCDRQQRGGLKDSNTIIGSTLKARSKEISYLEVRGTEPEMETIAVFLLEQLAKKDQGKAIRIAEEIGAFVPNSLNKMLAAFTVHLSTTSGIEASGDTSETPAPDILPHSPLGRARIASGKFQMGFFRSPREARRAAA